jgi:heptosyltransferase-3
MRILIIKYRNIGDVLLATALVSNLRFYFPEAVIDFATNLEAKDVLNFNPDINSIHSYDRSYVSKLTFFRKFCFEINQILHFIKRKYNVVINLTEGDRGALIAALSGAERKYTFKPRKGFLKWKKLYSGFGFESNAIHTVDRDLQFLKFLNLEVHHKQINIYWSQKDELKVNSFLEKEHVKKFVHVHPVSRWMYKCWDDKKMSYIIDQISNNSDFGIVITGSNDYKEKIHIRSIIDSCKSSPINLSGLLNLNQLAYLSSKAEFFFGVDTAPMHIAACSGAKVIALFGASSPEIWGPWDNLIGSTYKDICGIQVNGIHKVISHTDRRITYDMGVKKTIGMMSIKTEQVLREILKVL